MFFQSLYEQKKPSLSFEFFPPRAESDLPATQAVLKSLTRFNPAFMTVTSGAEPAKRSMSRALVCYIRESLDLPVIAHQTCWGLSIEEIDQSLNDLARRNIRLVLALRGDPSKSFTADEMAKRGFENALEFTKYIASRGDFELAVAGYPETHRDAVSPASDLEYLKQKVDVGASVVLTQLFFDNSVFFSFLEKTAKLGITVPIVPGILPVSSPSQLDRFVSLTGVCVPAEMREAASRYENDPESFAAWGADFAVAQCRELIQNGAAGIHLYTLNKEEQTVRIASELSDLFPLMKPAQPAPLAKEARG